MNLFKHKWLLVVALVLLIVGLFQGLNLGTYIDLEYWKSHREGWSEFYAENPLMVIGIYMAVYIVVTAFSLPGAAILTLGGGALFGLVKGTIIVSFASTIGATCAFLLVRFLLRDWVTGKFSGALKKVNNGVEKEGAFYLFAIRLVPVFPFFLVNMVMGVTRMRAVTFFWVSQLGMLPGTAVYVNAGTELGQLESLSGILSPGILISFALLGVLPLISKKVLGYLRMKRLYAAFDKPKQFDYNMVVIGAGSAGLVSSLIASTLKAKVALIEKNKMGGDCLNTGCVPSKSIIKVSHMVKEAKGADKYFKNEAGFRELDFKAVMDQVKESIKTIEPHDSVERYTSLGVDCIQGTAKIISPYRVYVGERTLTTKNIVVATGGRPRKPELKGLDSINWYNSDTIWELESLPHHLVVLGAGPIGCELAQAFRLLGAKVTLITQGERIMPREDADIVGYVEKRFEADGLEVITGAQTQEVIALEGGGFELVYQRDGQEGHQGGDVMLVAIGRDVHARGMGLEDIGVDMDERGRVELDHRLRTNYPNIYVCGDAAGMHQFTHAASHQAWYATVNALLSPWWGFNYDASIMPWCTFTSPEVARVGLSEDEAKQQGVAYEVTEYGLDDLDRAIADQEAFGKIKVLTVPGKDRILGVSIVGSHAGELIAQWVLAMRHGMGLSKILMTTYVYPTHSEASKFVAGNWKKRNKPEKVLAKLEQYHAWNRG